MPIHIMQPGDAVAELADIHGVFAHAIWEDPRNAALRARRRRYDALETGDVLFIPERSERITNISSDKRHRFLRKGIPAKIRFQLQTEGVPSANQVYKFEIAGAVIRGQTKADGIIEAFVPADARDGVLYLGAEGAQGIKISFANIASDKTLNGIRTRFANEGIDTPAHNDLHSNEWRLALYCFQLRNGLAPTMELDDATKDAIPDRHDQMSVK